MTWPLIILLLILLALATPEGLARESWSRLFAAMALSLVVVVAPLFVYFVSSFMVIDLRWKGDCRFGWLDCVILSKLAFAPFVLVATAALYRLEVLREKNFNDRWLVLGIYLGAVVSVACAIFGLLCLSPSAWLLVPIYVAVWYVIRARQLIKKSPVDFGNYFWATLATLPSWITAWFWAKQTYDSLPDAPPSGCFVVNAAGRGHEKIVGPFLEIEHRGKTRRANQQLVTLWQFENLWREKFPRSHKFFRRFYNRIGPVIAARITSPWLADIFCVALKPMEFAAKWINLNVNEKK
jgi:hypothetical protein